MASPSSHTRFIVSGVHLTENLLHHKQADVQRILEDKGFEKSAGDSGDASAQHYAQPGGVASDKQTVILFDEGGFVLEESGVQHLTDREDLTE